MGGGDVALRWGGRGGSGASSRAVHRGSAGQAKLDRHRGAWIQSLSGRRPRLRSRAVPAGRQSADRASCSFARAAPPIRFGKPGGTGRGSEEALLDRGRGSLRVEPRRVADRALHPERALRLHLAGHVEGQSADRPRLRPRGQLRDEPGPAHVPGRHLLQRRAHERVQLLGVGPLRDGRQPDVGVLRRERGGLAQRCPQHLARRRRDGRSLLPSCDHAPRQHGQRGQPALARARWVRPESHGRVQPVRSAGRRQKTSRTPTTACLRDSPPSCTPDTSG